MDFWGWRMVGMGVGIYGELGVRGRGVVCGWVDGGREGWRDWRYMALVIEGGGGVLINAALLAN